MSRKNDEYYFDMFVKLVGYSCAAAEFVDTTLHNFDPDVLGEKLLQIHKIEHGADLEKHGMMKQLVKEFITPIEREDIMLLVEKIDDLTDNIEDIIRNMYIFNIRSIRKEALTFSELLVKCCEELKLIMGEFARFRKSTTLHSHIVRLNELEEEGDRLHFIAMRGLYADSCQPVEIIAWSEMFNCLEHCCDVCENVGEAVERVIMKNS